MVGMSSQSPGCDKVVYISEGPTKTGTKTPTEEMEKVRTPLKDAEKHYVDWKEQQKHD
jgi:hypothetical protein